MAERRGGRANGALLAPPEPRGTQVAPPDPNRGGLLGPPPPPLLPQAVTDDLLLREYVSGEPALWYGQFARALAWNIDDITAQFGDDLYDRMAVDAQVAACTQVLKSSILEEGLTLAPAIDDKADADYDRAKALVDESEAMLDDLEPLSLDDVLLDLMQALTHGNRVAEELWAYGPPRTPSSFLPGRTRLHLVGLKPKPRRAISLAVDGYLNILGALVQELNQPSPVLTGWYINPQDPPANLVPPDKLLIYSYRPHDSHPAGTSLLRPAYVAWWFKQQVLTEYRAFLARFAGGAISATTPQDAGSGLVPNPQQPGGPLITPEQALVLQGQAFRNGAVIASPFGTEITVHYPPSGSDSGLTGALAFANHEITKALLTVELATEEGAHQARAAAEVHQDALDTIIRQNKRALVRAFRRQVLRRWVVRNFGQDAAHLTPKCGLGNTEQHDFVATLTAAADAYQKGFLTPDQLPAIDEKLGLPIRDLTTLTAAVSPAAALPTPAGAGSGDESPAGPSESSPAPKAPAVGSGTRSGKNAAGFAVDLVVPVTTMDPPPPIPVTLTWSDRDQKEAGHWWNLRVPALVGLLFAGTGSAVWRWDAERHRYRDLRTGKLLAPAKLEAARNTLADSRLRTDLLAGQLASGTLTLPAWEIALRGDLTRLYLAQYAAGRGGVQALAAEDFETLGAVLLRQFAFLQSFAETVALGALSRKQIAARSALYLGSSVQAAEAGRAAAWGVTPDRMPGDHSTRCGASCRCWLDYEARDDGAVAVWWRSRDDPEVCSDCRELTDVWSPQVLARPERDAVFAWDRRAA